MKKCAKCGHENSDEMFYCLDCGETLELSQEGGWQPTEAKTASFAETAKVVRSRPLETQAFRGEFAAAPPSGGSKKLLFIGGGVAALIVLLIVGVAAIVGYNYFARPKSVITYGNNSTPSNGSISTTANNSSSPSANPTPAVSFTPPIEPTRSGSFSVYANGGWQLSGIDTVALETFRTKVEGKVDIAGVKTGVTSGGVNDAVSKSRRIYPEFPTGALLMRTHYADGKFSNVAAVSANGANGSWKNFPDERGRIEFCINDNAPTQNGGQFTITVTYTGVAKK